MEEIGPPVLAAHIIQCLLIAFWYLCMFAAAVTALDIPFPRQFKEAVRLSAARGKTWNGKPSALGWLKDVSVPHIWFWHFYLVGLICNAATLCLTAVPLVCQAFSPTLYARIAPSGHNYPFVHNHNEESLSAVTYVTIVSLLVMCMLQTHLLRRFLETVFVMRYPASSRMHIIAYLYGLAYYAVLSVTFVAPTTLRTALSLIFRPSTLPPNSQTSTGCLLDGFPCNDSGSMSDGDLGDLGVAGQVGAASLGGMIGSQLFGGISDVLPLDLDLDRELVLDPASAVAMVVGVIENVLGVVLTDKFIVLVRSHSLLSSFWKLNTTRVTKGTESGDAIIHSAAGCVAPTPIDRSPISSPPNAPPIRSRVLATRDSDTFLVADCVSPVTASHDTPPPEAKSFDSLLISPGVSRAASRASSLGAVRDFEYKLPTGGMFSLVSCPHYLGEVVIYAGFLVMMAGRGLSPVVFLWVVMNLSIAAQDTHSWYESKFREYPRNRRALFPIFW